MLLTNLINPERPITPSITKTEKNTITKKSEKRTEDKLDEKRKIVTNLVTSRTKRDRRRLLLLIKKIINKEMNKTNIKKTY